MKSHICDMRLCMGIYIIDPHQIYRHFYYLICNYSRHYNYIDVQWRNKQAMNL